MWEKTEGEWIHVYAWLIHFAVHLKLITTLQVSYIPVKKKSGTTWTHPCF